MNANLILFWVLLIGVIVFVGYKQWWLRRGLTHVSVHDIKGMLDLRHKFFLVDVREPGEYESGHIPYAVNVPLASVEQQAAAWDKNQPVYVICQSGTRSVLACRKLMELGFTQVADVDGGMRRWPWGTA